MLKIKLLWWMLAGSLVFSTRALEILKNPGFESLSGWTCSGFDCKLISNHCQSGSHCYKATNRHNVYSGPRQAVSIVPGKIYHASIHVKLLTNGTSMLGERFQLTINIPVPNGSQSFQVDVAPFSKVSDGWIKLSNRFTVPHNMVTSKAASLKISGPNPGVEFLVDNASLSPVHLLLPDWKNATDDVINRYRKSDITVEVVDAGPYQLEDLSIQILQTRKSFPFGAMVKEMWYNDDAVKAKYRDFIHSHFNWAVLGNALKWMGVEHKQGQLRYEPALDAVHRLERHGLTMRGHNLVWSVEDHIQSWVKNLSGDALRQAVKSHIRLMLNITKGLFDQWDVNNENLHGQWFQDRLGDPDYDLEIFRIAHQADPSVRLFLNDFHVLSSGGYTKAYLRQAQRLKAANVGLSGLGAQCHFFDEVRPDPYDIKDRLDVLAQAGLPVWITELDVGAADEEERADFLEVALRSFYGHPAVEGIIIWGNWDKADQRGEPCALVVGDQFQMTAAGRRVFDLLENLWMTDETRQMTSQQSVFTVRGFHGDYELRVRHGGQILTNHTVSFTLGKDSVTHRISL